MSPRWSRPRRASRRRRKTESVHVGSALADAIAANWKTMAGHSHWAKIKRAKGANDAKRGKVWSKIARKIIIAAKSGGGDPKDNLSLRYIIEEGKAVNMPKDTITNAIKKGTGELGAENYEDAIYEAYAPGGIAILIEALTNNRSRTVSDLRNIIEKAG